MMSGKQKIYFLLNRIDDVREISPSGQPLKIDPMNDLGGNYREVELVRLFTKLERDEEVLKILKVPSRIKTIDIVEDLDPFDHVDDGCWHIELLPTFDEYYSKIQEESEYQEYTDKKPKAREDKTKKPIKYTRKALEKIWNVLQEIEEKRQLGSEDDEIQIPKYPSGNVSDSETYYQNRKAILPKLASLGAIKDIRDGEEGAYYYWGFKVGDKYNKVFDEHEEEYKKVAKTYQQTKQVEEKLQKNPSYKVVYSEVSREIIVNDFLIAKPDFDSENEVVFTYLFNNANQKITLNKLEKEIKQKLGKSLHKIVENLGFKRDLKKAFFNVSQNSIYFRNPVTKEHLDKLSMSRIKFP